jgi:hypothetical protein
VELFLQRYQEEQGLVAKLSKNKGSAKQVRQPLSNISKSYWETLSDEEKRARGQKAAQARWRKKRPEPKS